MAVKEAKNNRIVMWFGGAVIISLIALIAANNNPQTNFEASNSVSMKNEKDSNSTSDSNKLDEPGSNRVDLLVIPRPRLSTKLSLIGNNEKPSLAMIYKHDLEPSRSLAKSVMAIKDEFRDTVNLILVDADTTAGQEFIEKKVLEPSMLVFFTKEGKRQGVLYSPQTEEFLRQAILNAVKYGPEV